MYFVFASFLLGLAGCQESTPLVGDVSSSSVHKNEAPSDQAKESSSAPNAPVPDRVAIRHLLIAYQGAQGAPMGTNRSQKEALKRATELRARIADGESMAELAKRHSSDSSRSRGGFLGGSEKGNWVPAFEEVAFALNVGELSSVVETPFGYHVLQREPLQEVRLLHMVMQYQGARNLSGKAREDRRTKEAAKEAAQAALARLITGEDFESVASEYSDGPMGKRGADLGWFTRGEIGPVFDQAVFALAVGDTSEIIESPFGFHIVMRVE